MKKVIKKPEVKYNYVILERYSLPNGQTFLSVLGTANGTHYSSAAAVYAKVAALNEKYKDSKLRKTFEAAVLNASDDL